MANDRVARRTLNAQLSGAVENRESSPVDLRCGGGMAVLGLWTVIDVQSESSSKGQASSEHFV